MRSLCVGLTIVALAVSGAPVAAQSTWTGTATTALWSDLGNWNGGVPVSGMTATFNGAGGTHTAVDLGGAAQPIGTIAFDTANAAAYSFSGNAGDAFIFDANGGVSASSSVTTAQTFNSAIQNLGALNITNNTTGTTAPFSFGGSFSLASGGTADVLTVGGAGPVTISGSFGANFTALNKTGAGVLTLSGTNTAFTGNTTISAGSITVGSNDAFGSAGSVQITGAGVNVVLANGVVTNPNVTLLVNKSAPNLLNSPTGLTSAWAATWSGPIVFQANAAMTINFPVNFGNTLTISGSITSTTNFTSSLTFRGANGTGTGSGPSSIIINGTITLPNATVSKTDNDTWVINSTGNSWANTTLAVGTIQLGATNALPTNLNLSMGQTTSSAFLNLNGFDQTIGNLVVNGTANDRFTNTNNTTLSHLTINNTASNTYNQSIAGNLALIKSGPGTLTLSTPAILTNLAVTYTGGTTVTGGTLLVNNATTVPSGTGAGLVSAIGSGALFSGGTLGGTGTISGGIAISSSTDTTKQGGALSPGAAGIGSVGKLTVSGGASAWNPLGNYIFDHNASATGTADTTTSDFLSGTGTATLNLANLGTGAGQQFNVLLNPTNFPAILPTDPVTYTLATFAGGVTPPVDIIGADLTPYFTFTGNFQLAPALAPTATLSGNSVLVTFTPVPEPAGVFLLCAAVAGAAQSYRRRRQTRTKIIV
jgi:autotransporter-associated beta strand protein